VTLIYKQSSCSSSRKVLFDERRFSESSYHTPPVETPILPSPKAPIKLKKLPKRGDLRPKKLQYTVEEVADSMDSRIQIHSDQLNALSFIQHAPEPNKSQFSQKQTCQLHPKLNKTKKRHDEKENMVVSGDHNVVRTSSVLRCINNDKKLHPTKIRNTDVKEKLTHYRV
ncbi:uncharacterized protein LOC113464364, partial [Ceratina calcarata]|uniref:Uncharacterized protein LOC113464364 n=1 Tax=Ceratina calcarata TaxID=156304 RepID=A0AAJ7S1Y0_9HYME